MNRRNLATTTRVFCAAVAGYVLLTAILFWPLPRRFTIDLLADPSTDIGVYIWNLWVFRHELLAHGHLPFSTGHVFAYTGGADFSLHNYTPIAGALATPLMGLIGVVGTFNLLLMVFVVLTAIGVFLLAGRVGLGTVAAWSAGALFVASPVMTARATQHFSLAIAITLPLFLWALLEALESRRTRDAALVGVVVAAASYSDAYYPVYCVMMGSLLVASRVLDVGWGAHPAAGQRARTVLNVLIGALAALLAWRISSGTTEVALGSIRIGLQTLYTPVFVLALLTAIRAWLAWRPVLRVRVERSDLTDLLRMGGLAVGVCLILILPQLAGIAGAFVSDRLPETETYWRSSPRGVDVLAYVVPNPTHPLFGETTRRWFAPPDRSDAFPEFVGSFSIVALAVIALAGLRQLPRFWLAFTGIFVLLSLGPFIHVAGLNTYVPGPWAFLRYVPVMGMARAPTRFAIVAVLGLSLLFGFAIEALRRRRGGAHWLAGGVLSVALAVELVPAPRPLYSASVPDVYALVQAKGDETGRLLELPTGMRDGTSSLGDFTAASEYYQTSHERPLIGGYLSRVARWQKDEALRSPMLRALFELSADRSLPPGLADEARASRDAFLRRSCVRFVVVNKHRAPAALREFATSALRLANSFEDASYALLTPVEPPSCAP